ncbi:MAG: PH domain-containing protein [Thermoleophilia bacterium]|nr:PH domain-containing protein [Thermoleophilia bacterium]
MELHHNEQVLYAGRPSPRSSIGFYLTWGVLALLPGVLASVLDASGVSTGLSVWTWWLITLVLVLAVVVRDLIRRYAVSYQVTTERIHIRRGILSRAEQSTDIDRVQNVNTRQTFLDRALGVGSVDFDTAGTNAADAAFQFDGIAHPAQVVSRLQGYLIDRERSRAGGL